MNIPNTEDFLENIRQNWGTYLANSLRDLEKMNKFNKEDNFDGGEINIGPENFPIKLQFKIFQNKKIFRH